MKKHVRKIAKILKSKGYTVTVTHNGGSHYKITFGDNHIVTSVTPRNEDNCVKMALRDIKRCT